MDEQMMAPPGITKPVPHVLHLFCLVILIFITGCKEAGTSHRPTLDVPLEYADKHMPEGWWNDAKILSEGRLLYQGITKAFVKCIECHGRDGKPAKRGAPDFTDPRRVRRFSDSYWYWRIAEGVPMTSMEPYTKKLSDQEIWKIIAYQRNFGLRGQVYNPESDRWEDPTVAREENSSQKDTKNPLN
jgi:cytochrome c553